MKFKSRIKKRSGFDITPMIDIVFLLIIFFMVSSTLVKQRGLPVKLPESKSSDAETKNLIIIDIMANGKLYVNGKKVKLSALGKKLKILKLKYKQDVVIVKGDKNIPYMKLISVMDAVKIAGMEKLSLATSQKK
jgi:biopolymer transport protein ExbD